MSGVLSMLSVGSRVMGHCQRASTAARQFTAQPCFFLKLRHRAVPSFGGDRSPAQSLVENYAQHLLRRTGRAPLSAPIAPYRPLSAYSRLCMKRSEREVPVSTACRGSRSLHVPLITPQNKYGSGRPGVTNGTPTHDMCVRPYVKGYRKIA